MSKVDKESEGWAAYHGAIQATISDRERLHRFLDLYGAPEADDPAKRIVGLGEELFTAIEAVAEARRIVGTAILGDVQLSEWKKLREILDKTLRAVPEVKNERYNFLKGKLSCFFDEAQNRTLIQIDNDYIVVEGYHNDLDTAIGAAMSQEDSDS